MFFLTKQDQKDSLPSLVHPFSKHVHGALTSGIALGTGHAAVTRMWHLHKMKYYLAIKRNEILIYTTTWNLKSR